MLNLTQNEWREAMTLLDQVMDLEKEKQQDALRRSTASDNIRKVVQRLLSHEDNASDDALDQGAFNLVAPVVKSDDEFDSTAARALETLGSGDRRTPSAPRRIGAGDDRWLVSRRTPDRSRRDGRGVSRQAHRRLRARRSAQAGSGRRTGERRGGPPIQAGAADPGRTSSRKYRPSH